MRRLLDHRIDLSPRRQQTAGAVALTLAVLVVALILTGHIPFLAGSSGRTVLARFAEPNEVDDSTPVRVGGIDVGTVTALRPAPGATTYLVMKITNATVQLHSDASAQILWRTLLGGSMYVDLHPGSASAPPLAGAIPLSRTGSQVDWDEFNGQLTSTARTGLQQLVSGLDTGLGRPAAERPTLGAIGPALQTFGSGAQALRGQDIGDLPAAIRSASQTARALAADTGDLRRVIDGTAETFGAIASQQQALGQTLRLAPPAFAATVTTAHRLDATLARLSPLVSALRPGARLLAPTTTVLQPLLGHANVTLSELQPVLDAAPPVLSALHAMSSDGTPLVRALVPTISRTNDKLIPFLNTYDPDTRLRNYEAIGPFAASLDGATEEFDADGYFLAFGLSVNSQSVLLPCDLNLAGGDLAACNLLNTTFDDVLSSKP